MVGLRNNIVPRIMLLMLFIGLIAFTFKFDVKPVKAWNGTVYIKADGSIDPSNAPIQRDGNIYTLTGNITSDVDGIVIERDKILINGAGYTLQGMDSGDGIYLLGRNNVTIKNIEIKGFSSGISLWSSSNNTIVANNITECEFGVWLGGVVVMNTLNNIVRNNLKYNDYAISIAGSSNYIVLNNIRNSIHGIIIDSGTSNSIVTNNIAINEWYGIKLEDSYNNTIFRNSIGSSFRGICLYSSSNNTIFCNNVWDGVQLYSSSNNSFYHNNFGGISQTFESVALWDNGYPSGGNYWSYLWGGYTRVDEKCGPNQNQPGSDGICDAEYAIDANNTDRYPFMAPVNIFEAGIWNETEYYIDVVSNSTVSDFYFNPDEGAFLRFNVTGEDGTSGFCRVTIPKDLLWVEDGQWNILVGNETVSYTTIPDEDCTYLYFAYNHTTKKVLIQGTDVIPEFPSGITLLLSLIHI